MIRNRPLNFNDQYPDPVFFSYMDMDPCKIWTFHIQYLFFILCHLLHPCTCGSMFGSLFSHYPLVHSFFLTSALFMDNLSMYTCTVYCGCTVDSRLTQKKSPVFSALTAKREFRCQRGAKSVYLKYTCKTPAKHLGPQDSYISAIYN